MLDEYTKPAMTIIAGPNGSGKSSVTQRFLHHEWAQAILPDSDGIREER